MLGKYYILLILFFSFINSINGQKHFFQPELGVNVYVNRGYSFDYSEAEMTLKGRASSTVQLGFNYSYGVHTNVRLNIGSYLSFVPYSHLLRYNILLNNGEYLSMPSKFGRAPDGTCLKFPVGISLDVPLKAKHGLQLGFYYVNQLYMFKDSKVFIEDYYRYESGIEVEKFEYTRLKNQRYQGLAKLQLGYSYAIKNKNRIHFYLAFEPEITVNKMEQSVTFMPGSSMEKTFKIPYQNNHNVQVGMGYTFIK